MTEECCLSRFFIAAVIAFGRPATYRQNIVVEGVENLGARSILAYLFFDVGTLEPNVSLHMMLATATHLIVIFSTL